MIKYLKDLCKRMFKNPLRLTLKLFGLLWFFLLFQIFLKVTFNYWQPYVIPTEQLENIGNFIDSHKWLQIILNGIFYLTNAFLMTLAGIQQWRFKNIKQRIIFYLSCLIAYIFNLLGLDTIATILITILVPLVLNYKKLIYIIIVFILNFVFLFLSLFLEGFVTSDNMNFVVRSFLQMDYYIMLGINYFAFNLIRMKKELK